MKKRKIEPILNRLRQSAGTSKDVEVCRIFNIKPNTMDVWKQRDDIPKKTLLDIAIKNKIDFEWLLTGNDNNLQRENNTLSIPYYPEEYVSAGGGAYPSLIGSEPFSISVEFAKTFLGLNIYKDMFMLSVSGDSMEPTLRDKSVILINPFANDNYQIKDGAVYVIEVENTYLVKRMSYNPINKTMKLMSDNKIYDPIIIKNNEESQVEPKIIGRVVGSMDRV